MAHGYFLRKILRLQILIPRIRPLVLVGMDTRTLGPLIKNLAISALISVGVNVIDMDVCPTPFLLFGHRAYQCDGTVIISASHNPPEFNGMKCLAPSGTFLSREELDEINQYFYEIAPKHFVPWNQVGEITHRTDIYDLYLTAMQPFVNGALFNENCGNPIKVVIDPGAGAGTGITSKLLAEFGMDVIEVNSEKLGPFQFPREFEPIRANLTALSEKVVETGAAVGFAHDCDADRLGLIGETGEIYSEDTILALLINQILQEERSKDLADQRTPYVVTELCFIINA